MRPLSTTILGFGDAGVKLPTSAVQLRLLTSQSIALLPMHIRGDMIVRCGIGVSLLGVLSPTLGEASSASFVAGRGVQGVGELVFVEEGGVGPGSICC